MSCPHTPQAIEFRRGRITREQTDYLKAKKWTRIILLEGFAHPDTQKILLFLDLNMLFFRRKHVFLTIRLNIKITIIICNKH
jgi:hypothetical protein